MLGEGGLGRCAWGWGAEGGVAGLRWADGCGRLALGEWKIA